MDNKVAEKKVGKYSIVEKIGVGGFGEVYKGYDPFIKRDVAVKTCSSNDQEIRTRFFQEAEIAGNLHHRNVTTIYDFGIQDGLPYLIQEYLSGEDLDRKIKRRDFLPYPEKLYYLLQIARGLAYAHSQGVIHSDIKPANIRVLEDGTTKIMDFGIAKLAQRESTLTQTGMTLGTAAYLAPEQIQGEDTDHRTDLFSYGVLAYELLAYERPFHGKQISAVLYDILNNQPRPLTDHWPGAPTEMVRLIECCLEKDPRNRFADGNELLRELEKVQREGRSQRERVDDGPTQPIGGPDPTPPPRAMSQVTPETRAMPAGSGGLDRTPTHSQAMDLMDRTPTHSQAMELLEGAPAARSQTPSGRFTDLPSMQSSSSGATLDDIEIGSGGTDSSLGSTSIRVPPKSTSNLSRLLPFLLLALIAAGAGWWFGTRGTSLEDPPEGMPEAELATEDVQPTTVDVQRPAAGDARGAEPVDEPNPGTLVLVAPGWTEDMKVTVGGRSYSLKKNRQLKLPPGSYKAHFRVSLRGYEDQGTAQVRVEAGRQHRLESPIARPGALSVRPLPGRPRGQIFLEQEALGPSPIRRRLLAPRNYQITITPAGGGDGVTQLVRVESGKETILSFDLGEKRVSSSSKPLAP